MLYAWQQIEYQLDVSLFSGLKANRNRMSNLIIFVVSYSIGLRVEQRASTSRQAAPAGLQLYLFSWICARWSCFFFLVSLLQISFRFSPGFPPYFYPADSIPGPAWSCQILASAKCGRSNSTCAWRRLLGCILAMVLPKFPIADSLASVSLAALIDIGWYKFAAYLMGIL